MYCHNQVLSTAISPLSLIEILHISIIVGHMTSYLTMKIFLAQKNKKKFFFDALAFKRFVLSPRDF